MFIYSGDWDHGSSRSLMINTLESGIHSVQNGILLRSDVHGYFDKYKIAINPDVCIYRISFYSRFLIVDIIQNDYKTYCFIDEPGLDGITMFQNPDVPTIYQPNRALLKHHFRMTVLLNMKARVGYPEWDEDIPEGYDQMAEITNSEQGKLRFETVLAGKLNSFIA